MVLSALHVKQAQCFFFRLFNACAANAKCFYHSPAAFSRSRLKRRCVAALVAMLPGSYSANSDKALPLLLEKLNIEGTRLEACRAFGTIARAKAPVAIAPMLPELLPVLQVCRTLVNAAVLLRPLWFAQQHAQCHACSGTWARPATVLPVGTCT